VKKLASNTQALLGSLWQQKAGSGQEEWGREERIHQTRTIKKERPETATHCSLLLLLSNNIHILLI